MFVVSQNLSWLNYISTFSHFFAHLFLHSLHFCVVSAPAFAARQNTSKRDAQKKAVSIHDNRTSLLMFSSLWLLCARLQVSLKSESSDWYIFYDTWNSCQHVAHVAWEQYCWRFRNSASNREHQVMLASYPSIYTLKNSTWIPKLTIFQWTYLFQTAIFIPPYYNSYMFNFGYNWFFTSISWFVGCLNHQEHGDYLEDHPSWYSETTKSSLARLFSDAPMETQDSICHLFVISYGSAHSKRTRH